MIDIDDKCKLDSKLLAALYFQLWGVSVIHPFADGNGRAFAGKLVLDLQRLGFDVRSMPGAGEIHPRLKDNALTGLGPMFMNNFLRQEGIPLFDDEGAMEMLNNPQLKQRYMHTLHDGIEKNMRDGVAEHAFVYPYAAAGAKLLKACLSRDGFIDRSFYDQTIHTFRVDSSVEE